MPDADHEHDYAKVVKGEEDEDGNLVNVEYEACRICGAKKK